MKKKILIISVVIIVLFLFYRYFKYDLMEYMSSRYIIKWSPNVTIYYKDFEATPNIDDGYNIHYYHGMYLKANDLQDAHVVAFFNKKESWIRDSIHANPDQKELQKIRFDLYEYYARRANLKIDKTKNDNNKEFKDIQLIFNTEYDELLAVEKKMFNDDSKLKEEIKFWRPKVDSLLKTTESIYHD